MGGSLVETNSVAHTSTVPFPSDTLTSLGTDIVAAIQEVNINQCATDLPSLFVRVLVVCSILSSYNTPLHMSRYLIIPKKLQLIGECKYPQVPSILLNPTQVQWGYPWHTQNLRGSCEKKVVKFIWNNPLSDMKGYSIPISLHMVPS